MARFVITPFSNRVPTVTHFFFSLPCIIHILLTMADINAIAKQFTDFYYNTFDTNRANLQSLYVRYTFQLICSIYATPTS